VIEPGLFGSIGSFSPDTLPGVFSSISQAELEPAARIVSPHPVQVDKKKTTARSKVRID